jgi:hypothetical protein
LGSLFGTSKSLSKVILVPNGCEVVFMTNCRVSYPRGSLPETSAPNLYTYGSSLGSWSRVAGLSVVKHMGLCCKFWQLFGELFR